MSDVMLMGVLRMPPELWSDSELDQAQRHSRYVEAADRIEAQGAEIERLRAYAETEERDWTAIDAAIRKYLDDYELIGEDDDRADACYTPTQRERVLIHDAINGLLADESFVAAISAPQAEPQEK